MGEPKDPGQFSSIEKVREERKKEIAQHELLTKEAILTVIGKLSTKYKVDPDTLAYIRYHDLPKIIGAFGGVDNIKDKKILDIGCGSVDSLDTKAKNSRTFEPWLCRALLELGAKPVGVDILNLDREEFEHHQLDLLTIGALNVFPDKFFDGINLDAFFDSPSLKDQIRHKLGERAVAGFKHDEVEEEIRKLKQEISLQIKRLLKKDGKPLNIKNAAEYDDIRQDLGL